LQCLRVEELNSKLSNSKTLQLITHEQGGFEDASTGSSQNEFKSCGVNEFKGWINNPETLQPPNTPTLRLGMLAVKIPAKTNKKQQSYRVTELEGFRVEKTTPKLLNSQTLNSAVWRKK